MFPSTQSRSSGKERDTETGLDYFGARYYGSNMGHWMSPDWASNPVPVPFAKLENPQTLNLYSYVANNPTNLVDLDGHDDYSCDQSGKCTRTDKRKGWNRFWHNLAKGDSYQMKADDGKTYNLVERPVELKNGQKYNIIGPNETAVLMGTFVGKNARGPNDPPVSLQTARQKSRPGQQWDFKNQFLIPAYGRNTLYILGDTAHTADDIGNMTWGYVMSSYGIEPATAHLGAGLQSWQTYHNVGWCLQSLCDDPKDYKHVDMGYAWQQQNAKP